VRGMRSGRLLGGALSALALSALAVGACGGVPHSVAQDAGEARAATTPAARWPDQARYALDVAYSPRRFALAGTERITFRNVGPDTLTSVWVRAWANAFGGCTAHRAQVAVTGGGTLAGRQRSCTALEVRLAKPLVSGAETAITMRIRITVPPRPDRFGRFRGASYFGNAIPVLAVADRRGWQLPPYTFAGESFYSLTSSWRVRLRVPPGLQVASTGTQRGGRAAGAITLAAPRARDFMLVVGRFSVRTAQAGPVRLRRFSIPGTPAADARRTLATAALSMRRYAQWYGPYARPEVDLVEGPAEVAHGGVAMEYPELVLTPSQATDVAHELAHQWFYSIVGDDQWSEPWLDESFAEFSAARLPPRQVPNRLLGCHVPDGSRVPLDADMARMTSVRNRYVRIVYIGGACFLRAVQHELGAARFDAFMQRLVASHRDGVDTTADFVGALRAAAPGDAAIERLLRQTGLAR
jgi:Peptidase family M1 domain